MKTLIGAMLMASALTTLVPNSAHSQGSADSRLVRRVDSLERRIVELEERIARLERPSASTGTPPQVATGNARDLANWRQLRRGMNMRAVRELLGEPLSVRAVLSFTYWEFPNAGQVQFDSDRVGGWIEPQMRPR